MKLFGGLKSKLGSVKNTLKSYETAAKSLAYAKIPSGIAALSTLNYNDWVHDTIGVPAHEFLENITGSDLPEVSKVLGPLGAAIYLGADIGEKYYRGKADTLRETNSYLEKATSDKIKEAKAHAPGRALSAREIYWSVVGEMDDNSPKRKGLGRIKGLFSKSTEEKILRELRKNKEYYVEDINSILENPAGAKSTAV